MNEATYERFRAAPLRALVHHQERNLEDADHVEPEDHDHDAADTRDDVAIFQQGVADRAGREAERHEHNGEAA